MEQREGLLVSVILPAYNVANYLDDCLESAISQTYTTRRSSSLMTDQLMIPQRRQMIGFPKMDVFVLSIDRMVVFRRQEIPVCTMHRVNLFFLLIPMIGLIKI